MAGKPYRSKLEAHWDTIRELRQRRKSWREITEILRGRGVDVSQHALYNFVQVRRKWAREGKFSELPHSSSIGTGEGGEDREAVGPEPKSEAKAGVKKTKPPAFHLPEERPQERPIASKEISLEGAIAAAKAAAKGRAAHRTTAESVERIEGLTFLPSRREQESEEKEPTTEKGRRRGPSSRKSSTA
ncbi:hypothetical protein [Methylacidimicrobium sp. B4]|uniref:hypothetical protein n=1 Tax=Methylacidimicrobium sp. B4 TaxID=2796139 RepID=UPI001A8C847C|nr:hypothetical protein [Methylacidimicrobium sp. B4]QSR85064.1 hypothetical protein MacB4_01985 [Methylacidimicrobium sp. B4]